LLQSCIYNVGISHVGNKQRATRIALTTRIHSLPVPSKTSRQCHGSTFAQKFLLAGKKIKKEDFAIMTKSKERPVIMPGLVNRGYYASKSRVTENLIDLAGLGMPMQTSRQHKNRGLLDVSVDRGTIKMPLENNMLSRFPHIGWDGPYPKIHLHSGRTDEAGGHHVYTNPTDNRGVALGTYHFHHTLGPHIPCCRSQTPSGASLISLFREYNGSVWTLTRTSGGGTTFTFYAQIEVETINKFFALEITGRPGEGEFFITANNGRTHVAPFFWHTT